MGSGGVAPTMILTVSFFLTVAWAVLIFIPSGWQIKSTIVWDFDCGLYNVKVSKAVGGHVAKFVASGVDKATGSKAATSVVDFFTEGDGTIQGYRDQFCNLGMIVPQNCTPWNNLHYGSWVMLFSAILTAICLFAGSGFYYVYFQSEAKAMWRKWAMGFLAIAPVIAIGGMAGYALLTMSFSNWLAEFKVANQSAITFGFTSIFAAFVALLTVIPFIMLATCGKRHEAEFFEENQDIYGAGYQDANYGAAGCAPGQDPYGAPAQDPYAAYPAPAQQQYGQYPQQGY